MEQSDFNTYSIRYETEYHPDRPLAEIICRRNTSETVALIRFWKDNAHTNASKEEKVIVLNFDIRRFKDIIQILQYGKAVAVQYDDSEPIKTGALILENCWNRNL